jgi:hypothetical protein
VFNQVHAGFIVAQLMAMAQGLVPGANVAAVWLVPSMAVMLLFSLATYTWLVTGVDDTDSTGAFCNARLVGDRVDRNGSDALATEGTRCNGGQAVGKEHPPQHESSRCYSRRLASIRRERRIVTIIASISTANNIPNPDKSVAGIGIGAPMGNAYAIRGTQNVAGPQHPKVKHTELPGQSAVVVHGAMQVGVIQASLFSVVITQAPFPPLQLNVAQVSTAVHCCACT